MSDNNFDLIVIGAGCAGASGAMYASRLNLKTAMIGEMPGGLITTTNLVENWPGQKSISGPDLAMSLIEHAMSFGVPLLNEKVTEVKKATSKPDSCFIVTTTSNRYLAKTVLFATGTQHRKLNVPGEKELEGKGVSYCALCDGAFFKGKPVAVVGGGDSAAKEALLLAEMCSKVYLLIRDKLHAEPINTDRVLLNKKIEIKYDCEVVEVKGEKNVEKVRLKSGEEIDISAIFVAIGHLPLSDLAKNLGVELTERGEIKINRHSETSVLGAFAAGDVTDSEFKQAITGAAEGVTAAYYASDYLGKNDIKFD